MRRIVNYFSYLLAKIKHTEYAFMLYISKPRYAAIIKGNAVCTPLKNILSYYFPAIFIISEKVISSEPGNHS